MGAIAALAFTDEATLYSAGDGGVRRWNLRTGWHELVVAAELADMTQPAADGRTVFVRWLDGHTWKTPGALDLPTGESRVVPEIGHLTVAGPGPAAAVSGDIVAAADDQGAVRVGRISGGPVHWLVGHEKPVQAVAVSPDGRWVASTAEDDTVRFWPMPDLSKPRRSVPRADRG